MALPLKVTMPSTGKVETSALHPKMANHRVAIRSGRLQAGFNIRINPKDSVGIGPCILLRVIFIPTASARKKPLGYFDI
jgi:hypothetical protein